MRRRGIAERLEVVAANSQTIWGASKSAPEIAVIQGAAERK